MISFQSDMILVNKLDILSAFSSDAHKWFIVTRTSRCSGVFRHVYVTVISAPVWSCRSVAVRSPSYRGKWGWGRSSGPSVAPESPPWTDQSGWEWGLTYSHLGDKTIYLFYIHRSCDSISAQYRIVKEDEPKCCHMLKISQPIITLMSPYL